jgi:hypothetical protein
MERIIRLQGMGLGSLLRYGSTQYNDFPGKMQHRGEVFNGGMCARSLFPEFAHGLLFTKNSLAFSLRFAYLWYQPAPRQM